MELMDEPTPQDRLDQLLAFVLTLICVGLALLAAQQIRVAAALVGQLLGFTRAGFRLLNVALMIGLVVSWFVYTLWVADAHQQAHTRARIARARGRKMPAAYAERPVMRWLWMHSLHQVVERFAKNALVPLCLLLLSRLSSAVIQMVLL
jgi:hypothetical protein